jgi:hypothetical protein
MDAIDIKKYLSGGDVNTDPNASLGGEISSTVIVNNALSNLFDSVSPAERAAGSTEYRCFYYMNEHPTETLTEAVVFILSQTPSATTSVEIGLDPEGIGDGSSSGVATVIANETSAPSGVTFSSPSSAGSGLVVGDLAPGEGIAVWVKRVVDAATSPAPNDPFTLRITGVPE